MGRQILFSIDKETEERFLNFALEDGGLLINRVNGKIKILDNIDPKNHFYYLYKKEFGELIIDRFEREKENDYFEYINQTYSPVIEYGGTIVDHEAREIRGDRLWYEYKYYKKDQTTNEYTLIEKPKVLTDWYNKLNRWIKKNCPRTEFDYCYYNIKRKEYISPSLLEYIKQGYKIR